MVKSEYTFLGSELEKWLNEFFDSNGSIAGDSVKVKAFINELYNKILFDFDMISLWESSQGVLYAGWHSDIPMWQIVDSITGQSSTYCYISDTPAGMLMGKQMDEFQDLVSEIIGKDNVNTIFNGKNKYCSAIDGMDDVLSFNDFVSENLANKYVGNDGNALIFVSEYNPDSVLVRTELPTIMAKDSVKTINGIPKESLAQYYEAYKLSDGVDVANQKLVSAVSTVSEDYLSQIEILKVENRTALEAKFGKEAVDKFVSNLDVVTDTSAWADNIDDPISDIANDLDVDESIKQYITDNNKNSKVKNTEGLDDFISFQEKCTHGMGDNGQILYDVNRVPDGFTNRQWYDLVSKGSADVMSNSDILKKYKFLSDCTQADVDAFRAYEYFTSKGVATENIKSNGIYTDVELKNKYGILSDVTDQGIMDSFRTYEYRVANKTADGMNSLIFFDENGKIVGTDFSSNTSGDLKKPASTVFEATANDIKNYTSESDMKSNYLDYDNYSPVERLQARQYDYEKRLVSDMHDR